MSTILGLLLATSFHLHAEYRVYKLGVVLDSKTPKELIVLSTLDDLQFPSYYPVGTNGQVRLLDHWMCYGRTGDFKKYCPNPNTNQGQATTPTP